MKTTQWMSNVAISNYKPSNGSFSQVSTTCNLAGDSVQLSAEAIQFGFCVYEGMRVYVNGDHYNIFRACDHYDRIVQSCAALKMPAPTYEIFLSALKIAIESNWSERQQYLYLRPIIFAADGGIMPPHAMRYVFAVLCMPLAAHHKDIKLLLDERNLRTVPSFQTVKTASNYASSALVNQQALAKGYDSVLWLDRSCNVCECTTMNVFMYVGGVFVTPPASSVLSGITRKTTIELLTEAGHIVEERHTSLADLQSNITHGEISHIFTTSTALGINTVNAIGLADRDLPIEGEAPAGLRQVRDQYWAVTRDFIDHLSDFPAIATRGYVGQH